LFWYFFIFKRKTKTTMPFGCSVNFAACHVFCAPQSVVTAAPLSFFILPVVPLW
jgi:hypothetical protein